MLGIDLHALSLSPLLVGLRHDEIQALLEAAEFRDYQAGEVIVEEGAPGDAMFMLYTGAVVVEKAAGDGRMVELAVLDKQGEFFGEMVFVDVMPRSATVRAVSDARLLVFLLEGLKGFFKAYPEAHLALVLNIARALSQRLRYADSVIVELRRQVDG